MANKAIRYKLYPTDEQAAFFNKTFGCCRKIWNLMLADKVSSYRETKHFGHQTPAQYKKDYPYLKEVDSLALTNVQLHLQAAMAARFDKKRKKNTRFPRFKSKKYARRSYTTNNQKGTVAVISNKYIRLPKIGNIKAVIHRLPESNWLLKSATISQCSDGTYYASVLFEYDADIKCVPVSDNALGLDYASDGLYMDSNGHRGSNHKYYKESEKKLIKAQRRLSRRTGSKKNEIPSRNYLKQKHKVAVIHRHIANQRRDHLQKQSTEIANQYDIVCVEDLNMQAIANRKHHLGKHTYDNGYGRFLSMLSYKMADRGKYLVKVDKWFPSSQLCSCCGAVLDGDDRLTLRDREWVCPSCGTHHIRDLNAAINILNRGLMTLST